MKMKAPLKKLLAANPKLIHSEEKKVLSHVQRHDGDWMINTLMIEGCDAPFRYKRRKQYASLKGQLVNLTYYPCSETVAGIEMEVMKVVRVKLA